MCRFLNTIRSDSIQLKLARIILLFNKEKSFTKEERMQFTNLKEIERFLKNNAPNWKTRRGKRTYMAMGEEHHPADNYEVLQVFRPGESYIPFAEFWKGYYDLSPDSYTGFCRNFSCIGDLDFAMRDVIAEKERLEQCNAIIQAVKLAVDNDTVLAEIYTPLQYKHIFITRDSNNEFIWVIETKEFRCKTNQRCVMKVRKAEQHFKVEYWLQTWKISEWTEDAYKCLVV